MSDLSPGRVVCERYVLDRVLGEGGMGVVWAATHVITRKPVALKFLRSDHAVEPKVRQRFLREARAACAVRHANVVAVHDVLTTEDGAPFMVMDLLLGEPLSHRLARERRLSLVDAASILLPVAAATSAAHALGIVHRDLKPENIFLARDSDDRIRVQVLDFGIAKLTAIDGAAANTSALTVDGGVLGTPYYMSPEQVDGEKDVDQRSDIWSLGVILYECLSGVVPTHGDNIGQVFKIITRGTLAPLSSVARGVPDEVSHLVARMTSRDRQARPDSMREVIEVLRRVSGLPPGASLTDSLPGDRRIVVASDHDGLRFDGALAESPTVDAVSLTEPSVRRTRPAIAVGAVIVLVAIGVWSTTYRTNHGAVRSAVASATVAVSAAARASESLAPLVPVSEPSVSPTSDASSPRAATTASGPPPAAARARGTTKPRTTEPIDAGAAPHPSSQVGAGGVVQAPPF